MEYKVGAQHLQPKAFVIATAGITEAQLALLKNPNYQHPIFWAATGQLLAAGYYRF
ncbi:hypothetical protein [Nostoc foliaceum]|uniref:hypothetical protein n=1 Tax=Nostoc foliaceum TaxID=2692914 RepID=UPI001681F0C5|nr:hypothetical protein [Nostoc foliaceum]